MPASLPVPDLRQPAIDIARIGQNCGWHNACSWFLFDNHSHDSETGMNIVWVLLIAISVITAAFKGTMPEVSNATFKSAGIAVELAIGLVGGMTLFLGLMRVAEDAGLVQFLARALRPVFRVLFPDVPRDHPALGAIAMNFGANMLGLGDAATPFGIKAMEELQTLNPDKDSASDAMCMFVTLHSSSLQLIPVMVISLRAAAGSKNPSEIIGGTIFATIASMAVAITASRLFARWWRRRAPADTVVSQGVA